MTSGRWWTPARPQGSWSFASFRPRWPVPGAGRPQNPHGWMAVLKWWFESHSHHAASAGRVVFDETGAVVFEAGPHQLVNEDFAEFCEAFAS